MSTRRAAQGGWVEGKLPACRRCGQPIPKGRRTFCSPVCVHEWRLRTDPGYLRDQVFARDKGVCAGCGVDTVRQELDLKILRRKNRAAWEEKCRLLAIPLNRRSNLWDADHIVPVAEGGGECGLDNLRTVCLACHRAVTQLLRQRLRRTSSPDTLSTPQ
jgi:5-methylcytosine-specific restriction endonuclease McrA